VFSCCAIRWVTREWKVIDDSTANRNFIGVPHLLNEADHYKGFVVPKGSLVVPNAWYASAIITLYSVSPHVLLGRCSGTREFTWTQIGSTQTASWPLKAVSRRWIPAMSVYLDLGGGRSTHEVGREWSWLRISLLQQVPRATSRRIVNLAWCSIYPCCLWRIRSTGWQWGAYWCAICFERNYPSRHVSLVILWHESLTLRLLQSTASFPMLNQGPIRASSESNFCNIIGHQPIVHSKTTHALSVETDGIFQ